MVPKQYSNLKLLRSRRVFSDYSGIKLEISKSPNISKLNSILVSNQQVREELTRGILKNILKCMQMKTQHNKNWWLEGNVYHLMLI